MLHPSARNFSSKTGSNTGTGEVGASSPNGPNSDVSLCLDRERSTIVATALPPCLIPCTQQDSFQSESGKTQLCASLDAASLGHLQPCIDQSSPEKASQEGTSKTTLPRLDPVTAHTHRSPETRVRSIRQMTGTALRNMGVRQIANRAALPESPATHASPSARLDRDSPSYDRARQLRVDCSAVDVGFAVVHQFPTWAGVTRDGD